MRIKSVSVPMKSIKPEAALLAGNWTTGCKLNVSSSRNALRH